jgi:hypothetical protein
VIDDLDVVPVRVEHERAVVARVVDRALARRAVVLVARQATSASTEVSRSRRRCSPADVVDELKLVIRPMIAGRGRRLLDGLPPMQLESIRSEISPTGYLLVDYRVIR